MNTRDTLTGFAAAPALLPIIAPYAAPIIVGGAIVAGILWLLTDDEPKPATTTPGDEPAKPQKKRNTFGFFSFDESETASAVAATNEAARAARAREIQAEIDRNDAKIHQNNNRIAKIKAEIDAERRRALALNAAPAKPAAAVRLVTNQVATAPALSRPVADKLPVTVPGTVTARVPRDSATAATHRAVTPAPSPAATITSAPIPAVAVAPPAPAKAGHSQMIPRKYDRAHLEAVLKTGPKPRAAVVKALKAAPFNYGTTLAYGTLQRFRDFLEETPEGLLAWKPAN